MSEQCCEVELRGCAPAPLAAYLKALGILRLISEQVDAQAKGWWQGNLFFLRSTLDQDALTRFFLYEYQPTPLVGPWGARSGFFEGSSEKSARAALDRISDSEDQRLQDFRDSIVETRNVLNMLGLKKKAGDEAAKLRLLTACRAKFGDRLLQWLDSVYVLLNDKRAFHPLLGTGGNEGSGSYVSGFTQQVVSVLIDRKWDHALPPSLFGESAVGITDQQTSGHFSPYNAGGPNSGAGFESIACTNPWDYLLMLEGCLMFAVSAVKRLEDHTDGTMAFPFCVRPVAVGYASAHSSDENTARAEMWFPSWNRPVTCKELQTVLYEGHTAIKSKKTKTSLDFARSVVSLGTERGLTGFHRYSFQQRNGQAYFAVHLGRFDARSQPNVEELLSPIDGWLCRFRQTASSGPKRSALALRQLEKAIFRLCQRGSTADACDVLIALGECEATIAQSDELRDPKLQLTPLLLSTRWLHHTYDDSAEFRLAASLASIVHQTVGPFRRHLEPVAEKTWTRSCPAWSNTADNENVVWRDGGLICNLNGVLIRRIHKTLQLGNGTSELELQMPLWGRCPALMSDVADFIDGHLDDQRIEELLKGLMLINWNLNPESKDSNEFLREIHHVQSGLKSARVPDVAYCLLKLCHLANPSGECGVKLAPQVTHRAVCGDLSGATQIASHRLFASGFEPSVDMIAGCGERCRRIAAALVFPVDDNAVNNVLARAALRRTKDAALDVSEELITDSVSTA